MTKTIISQMHNFRVLKFWNQPKIRNVVFGDRRPDSTLPGRQLNESTTGHCFYAGRCTLDWINPDWLKSLIMIMWHPSKHVLSSVYNNKVVHEGCISKSVHDFTWIIWDKYKWYKYVFWNMDIHIAILGISLYTK